MAALSALALSGGGARAAYQAGVLKFVAELGGSESRNPFPIISAVSGGGIGAAILAATAQDFRAAAAALGEFWADRRSRDFYRGLPTSRLRTAWRIVRGSIADGWADAGPTRTLFSTLVDADRIAAAIDAGTLHTLSLGAYGYASQQTVHFFQGRSDVEPWNDGGVVSAHVRLGPEHLAATFALPFIFPPVKVHREYFCDAAAAGDTEAVAKRLGAGRIFSIAADLHDEDTQRRNTRLQSGLLQAAAHAVASGFQRSNERPSPYADCTVLRFVPSIPLPQLARQHWSCVPANLRTWLDRIEEETAYQIASLLAFEPPYLDALIELGYGDASAQRDEIHKFLAFS